MKTKITIITTTLLLTVCIMCGIEYKKCNTVLASACSGTVGGTPFICKGNTGKCIKYIDDNGSLVKCYGKAVSEVPSVPTIPAK